MKAQWASLCALAVALLVATIVYPMPVGQAADSALEGAAFGFWPIMWIVINALWIYNMTESTGHFAVLRRAFAMVSDDLRVQVVVIAFCFGALLEALAGFGTPAAICRVMLVGLGLSRCGRLRWRWWPTPRRSRSAPSRIPITTLDQVSGLPVHDLAQMVGRQTPFLALIVPFVPGVHGRRPARPARGVAGRADGGRRLRRAPVRRLQLRLDPAHRHHRLAGVGGRARRCSCAYGSPAPPR